MTANPTPSGRHAGLRTAALRLARSAVVLAALGGLAAAPATAGDRAAGPEQPSASWAEIRETLYADLAVADGGAFMEIDAPYRAHDAGAVPVAFSVAPPPGRRVSRLVLIVDENPAPVAAEFEFSAASVPAGQPLRLSTRLRVDAYSNVRAIAELDDGSLHQTARFVKASGGCSAPATRDAEEALVQLGRMRVRSFPAEASIGGGELQVMIRHPNRSGFQMDQLSGLYIPAWFVHEVSVAQVTETGDAGPVLMRMTGGISLSEDPSIRFGPADGFAGQIEVVARDTDGGVYSKRFALGADG